MIEDSFSSVQSIATYVSLYIVYTLSVDTLRVVEENHVLETELSPTVSANLPCSVASTPSRVVRVPATLTNQDAVARLHVDLASFILEGT